MQAIVFADRLGRELGPLAEGTCPALLPVAGKPLLEYALEDLTEVEVEEVIVVVSSCSQEIQARFGDGARWGVVLSYVLSRGEESPAELIERLGSRLYTPFLALRGDVLRTPVCREFVAAASWLESSEVNALIDGRPAGVCLVNASSGDLGDLAWPTPGIRDPRAPRVGLAASAFSRIDSVSVFHAANMDVLNGHFPGLSPRGRLQAEGVRSGRLTEVRAEQVITGPASLGDNCVISPSARLYGNVVIGDDCYVDSKTSLRSCVVLPGTYIGQDLDVTNAVVRNDLLIRVDTGTVLRVVDGELLAPMRAPRSRFPMDRLAGLMLLLLSLPLWPFAFLFSLIASPRQPLIRTRLRGNRVAPDARGRWTRQPVDTFIWACPVPVMRRLPWLMAVIRGDLRLFGMPAWNDAAAHRTEVPRDAIKDPHYGLLDAALFVPENAPEEEVSLSGLVLASEQGLRARLQRWLQAAGLLLTSRAWGPRPISTVSVQNT